ncbi:polyprenyl synthetase family protein [Nonomuraea cavernae]|uniref:Dimethylallyltransferase n=1 Tax=Nonomuraea cavernae TaxID=2045107 RepID=A0A917Z9J4_9ACTN|nr:polyprenyl synthetase family protein [Nonomuraea cavernae]MCA2189222.1 polyprenyl synthetase family protein [Nonomuraea cavernae]GGO76677.1 dimethylallyltransferase [Nonomuraea cavernae]
MDVSHQAAGSPGGDATARCRRLLEPALREAVSALHPWGAKMAAHTLGWSDADGGPLVAGGGKHLRPTIAMLCAEAVGAPPEAALPGAVAVELVHAFSLVHDDIIDHDERRRHREALWKAYGVGPALLAGDSLLALAVDQLTDAPVAMRYLSRALIELVRGQTEDMAFENRPWTGPGEVTVQEYTQMAAGKTGGLLGAAAAAGVALGGAPGLAEPLWTMGRELGVAFQIVDDLLGLWGDPAVTGKPIHNDLRRGKKTLPVLAALAPSSPLAEARPAGRAARELSGLLASDALDDDEVRRAAGLVIEAGGRTAALDQARLHLTTAMEIVVECLPEATELRDLCLSLVERSH